MKADKEKAIRAIVHASVESYAMGFSDRHLSEKDDPDGTINMKIHNEFIAALGPEILYYSSLARSLDSSLGNMLEKMAINIARLSYDVEQHVEGYLFHDQIDYIAELLEKYKRHEKTPAVADYEALGRMRGDSKQSRHESDYYLHDPVSDSHYLIELKIGGDLDNKKARSEKEALLEQYCILSNQLGPGKEIKILFATAYNRYGEGNKWNQTRVKQYFADNELCISKDFWNLVCASPDGYEIVMSQYKEDAHYIVEALKKIKKAYLGKPSR